MTRINLLLLAALVGSALLLVNSAYDARRLFTAIHRAEVDALRLAGEHKRIEAERQAQATNLRIDRSARERLAMRPATPAVTMYVVDPQARPGSGVSASAAGASAAAPSAGASP